MNLIVHNNLSECVNQLEWLESNLSHLHEGKTFRYTGYVKHSDNTRYGIVIEFKEPYIDKLNEILTDIQLAEYSNDWRNKDII